MASKMASKKIKNQEEKYHLAASFQKTVEDILSEKSRFAMNLFKEKNNNQKKIFENVSKQAWEEWLDHQKMLINEGQINLTDKEARKWLNEQMDLFLSGEDYARPKGYTPLK